MSGKFDRAVYGPWPRQRRLGPCFSMGLEDSVHLHPQP